MCLQRYGQCYLLTQLCVTLRGTVVRITDPLWRKSTVTGSHITHRWVPLKAKGPVMRKPFPRHDVILVYLSWQLWADQRPQEHKPRPEDDAVRGRMEHAAHDDDGHAVQTGEQSRVRQVRHQLPPQPEFRRPWPYIPVSGTPRQSSRRSPAFYSPRWGKSWFFPTIKSANQPLAQQWENGSLV